jgi:hypothetical protein
MYAPVRTSSPEALLSRRETQSLTAIDVSYGCVDWYCYEHAQATESSIAALVTRTLAAPSTARAASLPIEATG